jgi:hypothetical protein
MSQPLSAEIEFISCIKSQESLERPVSGASSRIFMPLLNKMCVLSVLPIYCPWYFLTGKNKILTSGEETSGLPHFGD